ncbi:MAG: hypothetical protein QF752_11940 [Planctomycetota bacterium]|nr:hypothetical protein [Planctomycetota bacterium]
MRNFGPLFPSVATLIALLSLSIGCSRSTQILVKKTLPARHPLPTTWDRLGLRAAGGEVAPEIVHRLHQIWIHYPDLPTITTVDNTGPRRLDIQTETPRIETSENQNLLGRIKGTAKLYGSHSGRPLWTFAFSVTHNTHTDPARTEREIVSWQSGGKALPPPTVAEVEAALIDHIVKKILLATRARHEKVSAIFFRVTPDGSVLQLLRSGHTDGALHQLLDLSEPSLDPQGHIAFNIAQIYHLRGDTKRAQHWTAQARVRSPEPSSLPLTYPPQEEANDNATHSD